MHAALDARDVGVVDALDVVERGLLHGGTIGALRRRTIRGRLRGRAWRERRETHGSDGGCGG